MSKPKAPKNCYWRGNVLWAKKRVAGEVHRFSLKTDNPAAARARVRAFAEKQIAKSRFGDDRKTWAEAVEAWGEWFEREKPFSLETYDRYLSSLNQLAPHLDGLYLDEIDKAKFKEVVRERRKSGVEIATIKRDLTAASSVFDLCEEEDWIDSNPALARNRKIRVKHIPIVLPDPAHIAMVIDRAPGLLAKMTDAAVKTGCRQNELATATRPNFDRERKQLTVIGKRNKRRSIELSDEAFAVFDGLTTHLRAKWLFWHDDGEPYRNVSSRFGAIVDMVEKAAQKSGTDFRPFTFHHLRHRYAVDFLKNGGSIYVLQGNLGHSSIKTTERYLEFLTPEEQLTAKFGARSAAQVQRSTSAKSA